MIVKNNNAQTTMNAIDASTASAKNSRHVLQKKKSLSQLIWNLHFITQLVYNITTHCRYKWRRACGYSVWFVCVIVRTTRLGIPMIPILNTFIIDIVRSPPNTQLLPLNDRPPLRPLEITNSSGL
jgi:hypothetical protein